MYQRQGEGTGKVQANWIFVEHNNPKPIPIVNSYKKIHIYHSDWLLSGNVMFHWGNLST